MRRNLKLRMNPIQMWIQKVEIALPMLLICISVFRFIRLCLWSIRSLRWWEEELRPLQRVEPWTRFWSWTRCNELLWRHFFFPFRPQCSLKKSEKSFLPKAQTIPFYTLLDPGLPPAPKAHFFFNYYLLSCFCFVN